MRVQERGITRGDLLSKENKNKIQVSITRTVVFKKSLTMQVVVTSPAQTNIDDLALMNNLLENAVDIASKWKGSGSEN